MFAGSRIDRGDSSPPIGPGVNNISPPVGRQQHIPPKNSGEVSSPDSENPTPEMIVILETWNADADDTITCDTMPPEPQQG